MDLEKEYRAAYPTQLRSLKFVCKPCNTIEIQYQDRDMPDYYQHVKSDDDLQAWLKTSSNGEDIKSHLRLIFCDQPAPEEIPKESEKSTRKRAGAEKRKQSRTLPFKQQTFTDIMDQWCLPRTLVKAIFRNGASYTRPMNLTKQTNGLVIQAEAPNSHDLIVALSWDLSTETTYAVVIGCTEAEKMDMMRTLGFSTGSAAHPLLTLAAFAEVQLRRLNLASFNDRAAFEQHSYDAGLRFGKKDQELSMVDYTKLIKDVMVNLESSGNLVTTLQRFRTQLNKIILDLEIKNPVSPTSNDHPNLHERRLTEQLETTLDGVNHLVEKSRMQNSQASLLMSALWNLVAQRDNPASQRIAKQSKEISKKAKDLAKESVKLTQDTREITTQARNIAEATKRDSTSMVAIATLTMFFLPLTFVASFLAMPIFNWQAKESENEKVVKGWQVGLYFGIAIPLTVAVVGFWLWWKRHSERKRKAEDPTSSSRSSSSSVSSKQSSAGIPFTRLEFARNRNTPITGPSAPNPPPPKPQSTASPPSATAPAKP